MRPWCPIMSVFNPEWLSGKPPRSLACRCRSTRSQNACLVLAFGGIRSKSDGPYCRLAATQRCGLPPTLAGNPIHPASPARPACGGRQAAPPLSQAIASCIASATSTTAWQRCGHRRRTAQQVTASSVDNRQQRQQWTLHRVHPLAANDVEVPHDLRGPEQANDDQHRRARRQQRRVGAAGRPRRSAAACAARPGQPEQAERDARTGPLNARQPGPSGAGTRRGGRRHRLQRSARGRRPTRRMRDSAACTMPAECSGRRRGLRGVLGDRDARAHHVPVAVDVVHARHRRPVLLALQRRQRKAASSRE